MGLFNGLKKLSQGNFGLISRNWGYIYCRLLQFHKNEFIDEKSILIGASVINANPYLLKKQFDLVDLHVAFRYAEKGFCGILPSQMKVGSNIRPIPHGNPSGFTSDGSASFELMVNYCVQYIGLLLSLDTPRLNPQDVLEATIIAKPKIAESLSMLFRELEQRKGNNYMANTLVQNVMNPMRDNEISGFMSELLKKVEPKPMRTITKEEAERRGLRKLSDKEAEEVKRTREKWAKIAEKEFGHCTSTEDLQNEFNKRALEILRDAKAKNTGKE